ncbi:hypothetical protein [Burkholderia vietnamiensis]|uniref:hypothetical protein n=1 Tax=Burkholderia vietnamiensis TaxID=60552 RepID=UPI0012D928F2|nr:hypothetical protein [Burkholderia vietnamiensis]
MSVTNTDHRAAAERILAISGRPRPSSCGAKALVAGDLLLVDLRQLPHDATVEVDSSEHASTRLVNRKQVRLRSLALPNPTSPQRSRSTRVPTSPLHNANVHA